MKIFLRIQFNYFKSENAGFSYTLGCKGLPYKTKLNIAYHVIGIRRSVKVILNPRIGYNIMRIKAPEAELSPLYSLFIFDLLKTERCKNL